MLKYWLWLTTRRGLGAKGALIALRHFGTPEGAFCADEAACEDIEGLPDPAPLLDKDMSEPEEILRQCYLQNIHIMTYADAAFPERLRNVEPPPLVLYYQGVMPDVDTEPVLALVGTRKASAYGLLQAKQFGYELGHCGAIIVSGGANGIDTLALRGALSAGNPVMAVLGCGVDVTYPAANRSLFDDIRHHGCLLSEYPPGTPPLPDHFPVRNRLLSGLSLGVVVVEAPKKSGAMITANRALEQGRDVFALPANVGIPTCTGNLQLLKEGAILAEEAWDILREYTDRYPTLISRQPPARAMTLSADEGRFAAAEDAEAGGPFVAESRKLPEKSDRKEIDNRERKNYIDVQDILDRLSPDERLIVQQLAEKPLNTDLLIDAVQLPAGRILGALTMLEIKGYVRRLPGNRFCLADSLSDDASSEN